MGGLLSYVWGGQTSAEYLTDPKLDVPDVGTNLTPRQKMVIRENWAQVAKDVRGNGVDLFLAFFKAHPSYQKLFKAFADVPLAELRDNRKLHAHAFSVVYAITSFVDNLEDVDCLVEILVKTGQSHGKRSIDKKYFDELAVVLVNFLGEKLGSSFTPFARSAWQKGLDVINSVIQKGIVQTLPASAE